VKNAPPGMPVEVLGFDSVPQAGDVMYVMPNEETAKDITEKVIIAIPNNNSRFFKTLIVLYFFKFNLK
ncbi:MAG: hypothetical protein ACPG3Z_05400, partial [Saprospiraceae bacterium]